MDYRPSYSMYKVETNRQESIHSGHFMVSQFEADAQEDDDNGIDPEEQQINPESSTSMDVCLPMINNPIIEIDTSLAKLFQCMNLAYRQKLTSPKWNRFKGVRLRWKDKIRLNNLIWRCWHMQFMMKKKTLVCQFASPLDVDVHSKPEAVVLEGKYWKRQCDVIKAEYMKWRKFYRAKGFGGTPSILDTTSEFDSLDWSPATTDNILMGGIDDYFWTSDTLFSTINNTPNLVWPDPREIAKAGIADFIQPSLGPLQPNLDDFMNGIPFQELLNSQFTERLPPVPEEGSDDLLRTGDYEFPAIMDESTFHLTGYVNRHNCRYWCEVNPNEHKVAHTQRPKKRNVWAGILGNEIIGPFFIDGNLDGPKYILMLHNQIVPAMRAAAARQNIPWRDVYFQQDGAAAHFSVLVRQYLNIVFPNRWIGRMGPINWPPRSPDLTPLYFFLWGYLKDKVFRTTCETIEEMEDRILAKCLIPDDDMYARVRESFEKRLFLCMHEEGKQFEYLLHKRKVQNFFPCKTPTRGHIDTAISGGHSVTYEDPDAHMGRRPLVIRHHNMEMLHSKALHYPSGYPMTRSPPLFVCSSPGPDPYRSHDNVYEELGPPRDSDAESDIALHSDDDFAEDESSLPGERSVNKLTTHEVTPTLATIYHERVAAGVGAVVNANGGCCLIERSANERNSLLSSSSSDRNACGSSSGYGNDKSVHSTVRNSTSPDGGLFRGGRRLFNNRAKQRTYSTDELNTSSEQTPSDVVPTIYDEMNLLTLPYSHSNSNSFNNHSSSHRNKSINCCNSTVANNDDVERRNHLNNQLSNNTVSTIYRGRTMVNGRNQPSLNYHNSHSSRSRTNPRSLDRRRINTTLPSPNNDTSYVYPEPMFHDGMVYDSCLNHPINDRNHLYPYILPEFTSFRNMTNSMGEQQPNQPIHPIYSRDSSFGSDSGYSHHTQTSGRGGGGGNSSTNQAGALSIWGRNKENPARKGSNTFEAS